MKPSTTWLPLSPGDVVQMIAPGMAFDWENLKNAEKILNGWGVKLSYPKKILGRHPVSANTREARSQYLRQALLSDSAIIWGARGGYGSLHLVSELKKIRPPKQAKLLIGFSDLTTLHHFLMQEWGWPVLHGPHVDRLAALSAPRLKELKTILFAQKTELVYKNLKPMNAPARKAGIIKSSITGGNMVTAQSTIGTPWQMQGAGKIIFFEEIGERGYKVDRLLEHFRLVGTFKKAQAIIFGPFVGGLEADGKSRVPHVLKEFAASSPVPVFQGLRSGHIPNSLSLPMNTPCILKSTGAATELTVSTGCTT